MECLLDEVLFDAPDKRLTELVVDAAYVDDKLKHITDDVDLSRYIL